MSEREKRVSRYKEERERVTRTAAGDRADGESTKKGRHWRAGAIFSYTSNLPGPSPPTHTVTHHPAMPSSHTRHVAGSLCLPPSQHHQRQSLPRLVGVCLPRGHDWPWGGGDDRSVPSCSHLLGVLIPGRAETLRIPGIPPGGPPGSALRSRCGRARESRPDRGRVLRSAKGFSSVQTGTLILFLHEPSSPRLSQRQNVGPCSAISTRPCGLEQSATVPVSGIGGFTGLWAPKMMRILHLREHHPV